MAGNVAIACREGMADLLLLLQVSHDRSQVGEREERYKILVIVYTGIGHGEKKGERGIKICS